MVPAIVPLFLVIIMWAVFLTGIELDVSLAKYGLYPRTVQGLRGILTIPFIHGSWSHLINNSLPMVVLGWALYKFYPTLATKTLFWIYLMSGIWMWISARPSYHIGASGVVYGLAAFLFLSGWLRREKRVAALSLLVAFLYGGLWWGVLPVDPGISWEGHLWGALAGFGLAVLFRKKGPQRNVYHWPEEDEMEEDNMEKDKRIESEIKNAEDHDPKNESIPSANPVNLTYTYKPSDNAGKDKPIS